MFPSEMLADMTAPFLDGDRSQRWLVIDDGRVNAICYFVPESLAEGVWNLLMIAVDPEQPGKGIGTKLMRAVEEQLADEGVRILLVDTSETDELGDLTRMGLKGPIARRPLHSA